jgi:hypothetical protein
MPRKALGPAFALLIAACVPALGERPPSAPSRPSIAAPSPPKAGARVFQGVPDDAFWVSREPALDRVIEGGARLELAPSGEVLAAAWDRDPGARGESLVGALALPERLGGGFVHWSRTRVFRSRGFTDPLVPIASGSLALRGVRAGPRGALVVTDTGLRELRSGASALVSVGEPALADVVTLDAARSLRLDVFGRATLSEDAGKTARDLSPSAGIAVRAIGVGEGELLLETWQGRFRVGQGGALSPVETRLRADHDPLRSFEVARSGVRAPARDGWPWDVRDATPLQAAVFSGAHLPDGSALGVVQSMVTRVDLHTGALRSLATSWIPTGLDCQVLTAGDERIFPCAWERFQGYGAYVLRAEGEGPPTVERAFSDEGSFVADDEGALAFTGSCNAVPRLFDPEDPSRFEAEREPALRPVCCVRRAGAPGQPATWIERRVELDPGDTLLAWIPRRDGTAVALMLAGDALPEVERAPSSVRDRGGVRVVRLARELEGWSWSRPSVMPSMRGMPTSLDRRFHARADGSIDGWLAPSPDTSSGLVLGVRIAPEGRVFPHDLPPDVASMVVTGDFGIAVARGGELYETVDHGRRWSPAGRSPLPPAAITGGGCSSLGCAFGPLVRLGWGEGTLAPEIGGELPSAPPSPSVSPRLVCAPRGLPAPRWVLPPGPSGGRQTVATGYGDTIELLRDLAAPEPSPSAAPLFPAASPAPLAPSAPALASAAGKPGKGSAPILRTHTLVYRPPFEPEAPLRRLNATDAALVIQRRASLTPLLAPSGEVALLIAGEPSELLVRGDQLSTFAAFEARRSTFGDSTSMGGLLLPSGRALLLSEIRRRLTVEEHGGSPLLPPRFLGAERDASRRRPMSLARRDDGAVGILVLDGPAPDTVGVVPLDRTSGALGEALALSPWSSLVTADDPRCAADPGAYRALVYVDPSTWLDLDEAALPGVTLGKQGLALVRWGRERVCLEGLDLGVTEGRRRGDGSRSFTLVARFGRAERARKQAAPERNAALRALDLTQPLVCSLAPPQR